MQTGLSFILIPSGSNSCSEADSDSGPMGWMAYTGKRPFPHNESVSNIVLV